MPRVPYCAAGLSSVQDDLFRSSFVDVYSSPSLKGVPWHAVLGYAVVAWCQYRYCGHCLCAVYSYCYHR